MQTVCGAMICYNEEAIIKIALDSFKRVTNDINVVDSKSTDKTVEILKEYGCSVKQYPIDNFRDQKNRVLEICKADWILMLDADEYMDEKLIKNIPELINNTEQIDAYSLPRKNYIDGEGPQGYPDYQTKLFRSNIRFVGSPIHEGVIPVCKKHVYRLNCGNVIHSKSKERQIKQNRLYYSIAPQIYSEKLPGTEDIIIKPEEYRDLNRMDITKEYIEKQESK